MLALAKHFAPVQAPPDASEAGATRLAALWKLSQTNRCRPKSKDRHLPSLKVAAKDAGLKGDAYHYLEVDGKKRKILKNNEYLVARILQVEGHESAIPAGWLQCQPVGEKRTVTAPMVAAGSAADFRPFHRSNRSLPGNDCVAYLKSWKRHLAEGQCLVKHWQDWGFMDGKRVWLQVVEGEGPLVQIPEPKAYREAVAKEVQMCKEQEEHFWADAQAAQSVREEESDSESVSDSESDEEHHSASEACISRPRPDAVELKTAVLKGGTRYCPDLAEKPVTLDFSGEETEERAAESHSQSKLGKRRLEDAIEQPARVRYFNPDIPSESFMSKVRGDPPYTGSYDSMSAAYNPTSPSFCPLPPAEDGPTPAPTPASAAPHRMSAGFKLLFDNAMGHLT